MPSTTTVWDAFISYNYNDRDAVLEIVNRLEKKGLSVFLASRDIPIGSSINLSVERGLYNSKALLVIISEQALQSSWIQIEVEGFFKVGGKERPSAVVILDNTAVDELPDYLREWPVVRRRNQELDIQELLKVIDVSPQEIALRAERQRVFKPDIEFEDAIGHRVIVEIKIGKSIHEFNVGKQEEFLRVLANLLEMDVARIRLVAKREGSVVYQLSFTPEHAAHLIYLLKQRELDELSEFDVIDINMVGTSNRVFIGHGRSPIWRELKDFLEDRLRLPWDEFNRESVAGYTTTERLEKMLEEASFAFIIMTGEDLHDDNELHARESVIHEIGLFQGKLGRTRAIIMLEEGCSDFSNIRGLTQLRFPKGNVEACFEEVRRVLEREGVIDQAPAAGS